MVQHNYDTDVVIVGGGPVGLYLAGKLLQNNISAIVLEQKTSIDQHSKSLGIHPVSMELFEEAGFVDSFLNEGLKIETGAAFVDHQKLGDVSFKSCPKPYNFILALPQFKTESILEKWVKSLSSDSLIRGATVTETDQNEDNVIVQFAKNGSKKKLSCRFLIGCDGKNSFVREQSGINVKGKAYPDTYIMGDFSDNTDFGSKAAVYLHKFGLIESFPLPNSHRRWVVKTDEYINKPSRLLLEGLIESRLGHSLKNEQNYMVSSFGVQHQLAEKLYNGRVLLAGDSAHVVSPIGGQGMNLGWINADLCAKSISDVIHSSVSIADSFSDYSETARKIAKQVGKRAEMNMQLGRNRSSNIFFKPIISLLIRTPLSNILARIFTMRGLGRWPV